MLQINGTVILKRSTRQFGLHLKNLTEEQSFLDLKFMMEVAQCVFVQRLT
jgi:hypothetical protein